MPDIRNIRFKPRDVALAARVVDGMPVEQARREVGILGTGNLTMNQQNLIEVMREEMQKKPGHTFKDAAQFYLDASTGKKRRKMTQILARARHDKIMGYDAPQKVEVHERKELSQAVLVLHAIADRTGLTPAQLFKQVKEIPDGTDGTQGNETESLEMPSGT